MASKATRSGPSEQIELVSIGIDIGKDVFHIVGFDLASKIALAKPLAQLTFDPNRKWVHG